MKGIADSMFDIKENLKKLPDCPGVYMHKDKLGQVIYVGKAISLRNRVRQYFQASANHSPKVKAMVSHIAEFEYITCKTEMEALILECNLIKKYAPKYNVLLRDDKTYPYIKVTMGEEFPRVLKTRLLTKDGSKYFGPYSDAGAVNEAVELLSDIYTLKRCSARSFPEGHRPCLNYHINRCKGVCVGGVSAEEYRKNIADVIEFLNGKQQPVIDYLTEKMTEAAEKMEYEEAAVYRDKIASIKSLAQTQRVTITSGKDFDIVLSAGSGENSCVVLFPVRDGKLSGREIFDMHTGAEEDSETIVSEFIKQYYSTFAQPVHEILVARPLAEAELISEYLASAQVGSGAEDRPASSAGRAAHISIHVPQKGEKRALLELAKRDVTELAKTLEIKQESAREKEETLREALTAILGERKETYRVESYDISNTNGVDTVGAMVVFSNLKPVKKDYRRFKIKTIDGQNDYGALQEMLYRRFKRALEGDAGFINLPDLILMDGGQGQVSAAEKIISAMGLSIPTLGMAKDDSHRTRALVNSAGEEFLLKENPFLFKYCGRIQEEVHRFAIEYHRSLRTKNSIGSLLDNIEGIGPAKRNALLSKFKSIENIKQATTEELTSVHGITEKNAHAIKEYFG